MSRTEISLLPSVCCQHTWLPSATQDGLCDWCQCITLCWRLAPSCTRKAGEIKGSIRASCKRRMEKMVPADIIRDLLPASYLLHIKIKQ